ncbi:transcriptional regulator, LacI family [human gut metagenome]|uniref:Transcriptional regulator, LacI family n=1 Tax=human gut metagenome TaxID=408170 RepID=K1RUM7_9ZZZZ
MGIVQWFSAEQELQDTYYLSVRNGIEDFCIKNCIQIVRAFKTDVNYMDYLENINGLICIGKFSKKRSERIKENI